MHFLKKDVTQIKSNTLKCKAATPYLRPLPVAAGHVDGGDVLEELLSGDEVGQAGEELSHVDEVHAGQDVLVETQQAQRRAEQELLAVSAEHVPDPARQVQRQRLTVQSEDPAGTAGGREKRGSKGALKIIHFKRMHT